MYGLRKKQLAAVLIPVCLGFTDHFLKHLAVKGLFSYTLNSGLMFGILPEVWYLSIFVYLLSSVILLRWCLSKITPLSLLITSLFIGGGLSNTLDRLVYGGVIDYIPLFFSKVNASDLGIIASLFLLSYHNINIRNLKSVSEF
ncbi:MAG: hypothetical protein A3F33_01030 [Candidatus Woykebacteria bacterium RIFCSPHIGHO2_12_FULL_43_10]|uniref:Uncharacterized protein n=2 Tax=Candidatus Woykeibacteriota TaxID=1817899 RepID=A0A1G1WW87_9BACT|nr:MAG: hypothetical protein A2802_00675 [Candidatus Woykebacteria bacterium RIFCSPHIGHO2_01_FULL_43_29]OGY29189.1 MAG: hypothetical protein A3F33_01030 [Candidatus Woykebacteria bacterium RIFCSPHIGHO2_12_FULL_43_10]OGY30002.1 MAG: hypothetical protein A3J50_02880 [Candidatus Woykebacteria bacterium RIFCSPHIGHO2_02_FULL_43_16b]OGY32009.1 MAG: hypothetical protein A3A61_01155 [Candidatus Woykebacteria bacterium RIFCSPLOWO2_01_FULL_43_14]